MKLRPATLLIAGLLLFGSTSSGILHAQSTGADANPPVTADSEPSDDLPQLVDEDEVEAASDESVAAEPASDDAAADGATDAEPAAADGATGADETATGEPEEIPPVDETTEPLIDGSVPDEFPADESAADSPTDSTPEPEEGPTSRPTLPGSRASGKNSAPTPAAPRNSSGSRFSAPADADEVSESTDADESVMGEAIPAPGDDETDGEVIPQETIRERYEDGTVKIERGVTQDERENYVNHGPWRMFDPKENVIAEGTYRFGQRDGTWSRTYQANEIELLTVAPFTFFTPPFVSEATFRQGKLQGTWSIRDATGKKVCAWQFVDGRRDGESIWYYHTGRPMRSIRYRAGQIHGAMSEWGVDNQLITQVEYQDGRRLERSTEKYEDGQKKVEGMVLQARLVMKDADDWWTGKLATYTRQGKDQKHGEWTAWFPDGQMKFTGVYQYDKPHGKFSWWHENGQKSLEANYQEGRKVGNWAWWHANGQKSIQGQYLDNNPVDRWVWWHESGKVAQRIDFTAANARAPSPLPATDSGSAMSLQQPQN